MQALRTNISTRYNIAVLGMVCVTLLATAPVQATTTYGDFMGANYKFINVNETAVTTGDTEPLFGEPTISGDALVFTPKTFSSSAPDETPQPPNSDLTVGLLNFIVEAAPGKRITDLQFVESGGWIISATGILSENNYAGEAHATIAGTVFVNEIDNAPVFLPPISFGSSTPALKGPGGGAWALNEAIDLNAILASAGISPNVGVTKVTISVDDQLSTAASLGASAFIDKKLFGVNVVPEPSTGSMGLLGLIFGLSIMRRRNNKS